GDITVTVTGSDAAVTARCSGESAPTTSADLLIKEPVRSGLTISPGHTTGGDPDLLDPPMGTISGAPEGAWFVIASSSEVAIPYPNVVQVADGQARFNITTESVTHSTVVTFYALCESQNLLYSATLTVD